MRQIYKVAVNPDIDLSIRYDAVRTMIELRKDNPVNHERLRKKRDYQAEYRRRQEMLEELV